jgi:virginiamycin B lyase
MRIVALVAVAAIATAAFAATPVYFEVPRGGHPHDVAADPAPGGPVYYTAQHTGKLGILDPFRLCLAPHGVAAGPTRGSLTAGARSSAPIRRRAHCAVRPPADTGYANLNTAVRSPRRLWFTGQRGYYGRSTRGARFAFGCRRAAGRTG